MISPIPEEVLNLPIPEKILDDSKKDGYEYLITRLEKVKEYFVNSIKRLSNNNEGFLINCYHRFEEEADEETDESRKDKKYLQALKFRLGLDLKIFKSGKVEELDYGHVWHELTILNKIRNFELLFQDSVLNTSEIKRDEYGDFKYKDIIQLETPTNKKTPPIKKKKTTKKTQCELPKDKDEFDIDSLDLPWRFPKYNCKINNKFQRIRTYISRPHQGEYFLGLIYNKKEEKKILHLSNLSCHNNLKIEFLEELYNSLIKKIEPKNIYEEYQIEEFGFSADNFTDCLINLVDKYYNISNLKPLIDSFRKILFSSSFKTLNGIHITFSLNPKFLYYLEPPFKRKIKKIRDYIKWFFEINFLVKFNYDHTVNIFILHYKKYKYDTPKNHEERNRIIFEDKICMTSNIENYLKKHPYSNCSNKSIDFEYNSFMLNMDKIKEIKEITHEIFKIFIVKLLLEYFDSFIKKGYTTPKKNTKKSNWNGKQYTYLDLKDLCEKYIKNYIQSLLKTKK